MEQKPEIIKQEAGDIQRYDELIVVTKPELPEGWDYDTSVKSMKRIMLSWMDITREMIEELSIARELLSSQGKRTDIGTDVPRFPTWEQYCNDVGISKRQANRITDRYLADKIAERTHISLPQRYTQVEKVEEKTEKEEKPEEEPETKVKAEDKTPETKVEPREDGIEEKPERELIEIVCPRCKWEFLYDVGKGEVPLF